MKSVSVTEAKQRFGAMIDAAQREPVIIRRNNREVAVLMSAEEYDRVRNVDNDEFEQFCDRVSAQAKTRGLTEKIFADIMKN